MVRSTGYEMTKDDYQFFDEELETVTLTPNTATGFDTGAALGTVKAGRMQPKVKAGFGSDVSFSPSIGIGADEQRWSIYAETCGNLVPKGGMKLTDWNGVSWIIGNVRCVSWGTVYVCDSTKAKGQS